MSNTRTRIGINDSPNEADLRRSLQQIRSATVAPTAVKNWGSQVCHYAVSQTGFRTVTVEIHYQEKQQELLTSICKLAALQARKQGWKHIVLYEFAMHNGDRYYNFSNRSVPSQMLLEDLPLLTTASFAFSVCFELVKSRFEKNHDRDYDNIWEDQGGKSFLDPVTAERIRNMPVMKADAGGRPKTLSGISEGIHPMFQPLYEFRSHEPSPTLTGTLTIDSKTLDKIRLFNGGIKTMGEVYGPDEEIAYMASVLGAPSGKSTLPRPTPSERVDIEQTDPELDSHSSAMLMMVAALTQSQKPEKPAKG